MTPWLLGVLAVLLAGPVPLMLAGTRRLHLTPVASLVLWQAVALSAVLAALGAGLSLATDRTWGHELSSGGFLVAAFALVVTGVVLVRLLVSGHRVGTALRHFRARHRAEIDLLAQREGKVSVLDHPVPVAYCIPAVRKPRVVVSAATVQVLSPEELSAVLAHERAHLVLRHDLVLEAFTVLHRAFPRWVSSDAALREVALLVEIQADRAAAREGRAAALGNALLAVASGRAPAGALGAAGGDLVARVRVLGDPRSHRIQTLVLGVAAWTVLVLPTALVVAPWLSGLATP